MKIFGDMSAFLVSVHFPKKVLFTTLISIQSHSGMYTLYDIAILHHQHFILTLRQQKILICVGSCALHPRTASSCEHLRTYRLLCHMLDHFQESFAGSLQECHTSEIRQ